MDKIKKLSPLLTGVIILLTLAQCFSKLNIVNNDSFPPDHSNWDTLLKQYVTDEGNVNYQGFIKDSLQFNQYLELLSDNAPNKKNWTENDRLAYWINVYNAFTVQLIIRNYPLKSIKDISGSIPFINSSWDIKFININGEKIDLNNVEHGIIREKFSEPRIHFAVNCASFSCPRLQNFAYTGTQLNEQLEEAAREFINNKDKNEISSKSLKISKIFKWYSGDFKKWTNGTIIDYLNRYANIPIDKNAQIDYLDYNWTLNE